MKYFYLFVFNLYLFATNHHDKEPFKEPTKDIKTLKKEALIKIFKEPKFKNTKFVKHSETLTNWNYFINILNQLLNNLKINIVTFPSKEKEDFYKDLTTFLDNLTAFLLWEKDNEPEIENIHCSTMIFPKINEKANWQTKDCFIENTSEIFEHINNTFPLFKNYLLIENELTFLKKNLKLQLQFIKFERKNKRTRKN